MSQPLTLTWRRVGPNRRWTAEGTALQVRENDTGRTYSVLAEQNGALEPLAGRNRYRSLHAAQLAAEAVEWITRRIHAND